MDGYARFEWPVIWLPNLREVARTRHAEGYPVHVTDS